jgi:hypothetical protein
MNFIFDEVKKLQIGFRFSTTAFRLRYMCLVIPHFLVIKN